MSNPFRNDSPLGHIVQKLLDLLGLNILWFVCCLPILTVGAATTALHFALAPQDSEEAESVYRRFFRSFRREFKRATLLWGILLVLSILLAFCFRIVSFWEGTARTAGIVFFCFPALLLLTIAGYGFPLLAQFEIPTGKLLGDALLLGIAHFPKTLLIIGLNLLPAAALYFFPSFLIALLFLWLPIGFSLTAAVIEKCLESIFAPLRKSAAR